MSPEMTLVFTAFNLIRRILPVFVLVPDQLTSAIFSLSLSREWKALEIDQIFRYLDKAGTGQVDVRALDALLYKVTAKKLLFGK